MSQAGSSSVTGNPAIPTTFTTDSGNAVPVANVLNVLAEDSTANNDNGIRTTGAGNTVTIQLTNRATGGVSTTDATPTTALTFSLGGTAGTYFISGDVVGWDATSTAGCVFSFTGAFRTSGAAATEIGAVEYTDAFRDAALAATAISVAANGNDVEVQVQGIAEDINWNVYLTFRFVS